MSSRSRPSNTTGVNLSRLGIINNHLGDSHVHQDTFSGDVVMVRKKQSLRLLFWKKYFQHFHVSMEPQKISVGRLTIQPWELVFLWESGHVTVGGFPGLHDGRGRGTFQSHTTPNPQCVCCNTKAYHHPHSTQTSRQKKCMLTTKAHDAIISVQVWLRR